MVDDNNSKLNIDRCIKQVEELHELNPTLAIRELNQFNSKIKNLIDYESSKDKNNKNEKLILVILSVIILLEGLLMLGTNNGYEQLMFYVFGYLFFISGHFVGMNIPYFGLIFLFSHSITGMCFMLGSFIGETFTSPAITDISYNAIEYLVITLILFILATLYVIAYNVSGKIRNIKYSKYIPLVIYAIAFLMVGLFNYLIGVVF